MSATVYVAISVIQLVFLANVAFYRAGPFFDEAVRGSPPKRCMDSLLGFVDALKRKTFCKYDCLTKRSDDVLWCPAECIHRPWDTCFCRLPPFRTSAEVYKDNFLASVLLLGTIVRAKHEVNFRQNSLVAETNGGSLDPRHEWRLWASVTK